MVLKGPRKRHEWTLIKRVSNSKNLDKYMFRIDETFKQNNQENCQLCRINDHKMRAKYTNHCGCGYAFCLRRHRAYICCKKQTVKLAVKGQCIDPGIKAKKDRNTVDRGIALSVKTLIDRMIKEDIDLTPKKYHLMLIKTGKISPDLMPLLYQVLYITFIY